MIKFTAKGDGRQLVGLGITEENVKRLREGLPILVRLKDLDIQGDIEITIFYGHDEAAIYNLLAEHQFIGPKTKVKGQVPVDNDLKRN